MPVFWIRRDFAEEQERFSKLNARDRGVWLCLTAEQFHKGAIPNSVAVCSYLCGIPEEEVKQSVNLLLDHGILEKAPDGSMYDPVVSAQIEKAKAVSAARSAAGRKGGRPKANAKTNSLDKSPVYSSSSSTLVEERVRSALEQAKLSKGVPSWVEVMANQWITHSIALDVADERFTHKLPMTPSVWSAAVDVVVRAGRQVAAQALEATLAHGWASWPQACQRLAQEAAKRPVKEREAVERQARHATEMDEQIRKGFEELGLEIE